MEWPLHKNTHRYKQSENFDNHGPEIIKETHNDKLLSKEKDKNKNDWK